MPRIASSFAAPPAVSSNNSCSRVTSRRRRPRGSAEAQRWLRRELWLRRSRQPPVHALVQARKSHRSLPRRHRAMIVRPADLTPGGPRVLPAHPRALGEESTIRCRCSRRVSVIVGRLRLTRAQLRGISANQAAR
jgi:hypothetical protein